MRSPRSEAPDAMWSRHHAEWRDAAQITSQWKEAADTDPRLLCYTVRGAWWDTLAAQRATLLVTREYEHLVIAMGVTDAGPVVSYMPMPHPSGLAIDDARGMVHIASTRNPNQVYDLMPVTDLTARLDVKVESLKNRPLVPVASRFYPGCLYIHDLAIIGGALYATAVGHNSVVRLDERGRYRHVWWPRCVETDGRPVLGQNYIQLNSIAAGADLETSYYSASADRLSVRRPGHRNFPVDGRGVIFSGATREAVARGLTRPHSARLHNGLVWLANSGYGEVGFVENGGFVPVVRLPGWTRGLCVRGRIAFVGTSRVIPRFRRYAPGLAIEASQCGVHAVDVESGQILGSLIWPDGNQIFAVESAPSRFTSGFPFIVGARRAFARQTKLFYTFHVMQEDGG